MSDKSRELHAQNALSARSEHHFDTDKRERQAV
jgi:hypothetical protein